MTIEAKKENGSLTITLEGEINNMAAPKFEKAYLDNREDIREVCIDMEKATYLTSAALRVILFIQQEMDDCGGSLKVCRVNDDIMEVFSFTGFSGFLIIE
ncbi:MAG: STAS domain-containing protein [Clostridia bacterium]|nr:STAS domain-containing protein [Clostridia bacterium]MBR6187162.1 STAS domain-containing protein [Clostridia bacterium]